MSTSPTRPARLNLIVGDESFLVERARRSIIHAQQATATAMAPQDVTQLRAGELTRPLLAELFSPSLFGDERVIVITDTAEAGAEPAKDLLEAVTDLPDDVVVIIEHSGGGRQKALVQKLSKLAGAEFAAHKLKVHERPDFVRQEFRRHRVKVSPDVVETVVDAVGSDLRELASAVSQLVSDTGGTVDAAAVRRYYGQAAEVSGFDVADLACAGRTAEALAAARRALQLGVPHVLLASALTGVIGDLSKVCGARSLDPFRDAATFGMPPWKLKKTIAAARHWSTDALAQAVQVAAQLDGDVKGEAVDMDYAVEKAIAAISSLAGSGATRR